MKVPFSWLQELVEINIPIHELSESLSIAGFEVEDIEDLSTRADNVVVGLIKEIEKHPQADRLNICQVDVGENITKQIVCGAPNVRKGRHVLVAKVGSLLSAKNIIIKSTEIRGIKSDGMICSLAELGFADKSNGIAILEEMNIEIPHLGESASYLLNLNEQIIDLAITANRPDGMSMMGIAREVSALTESKLNIPNKEHSRETTIFKPRQIDDEVIGKSEIYSLTIIENVNGSVKANDVIKNRIEASGIKSINAIVDLTNYIMLEQGQPLHAFDLDALELITNKKVDKDDFGIRKAKSKEEFEGLDGKKYELDSNVIVITCHDITIAIAGLIGGMNSSVTKNTKRIILEGAIFSPSSVRRSSRTIGLRTEASSRYEKGISKQITITAVQRFIEMINEYFEIKVSKSYTDKELVKEQKKILLRRSRIDKILGGLKFNKDNTEASNKIEEINYIKDDEIELKLNLLGCITKKEGENWSVKAPDYRSIDLVREIDLIEEIARLIGYDKFEANLPKPIKPGGLNPKQSSERKLRTCFSGAGFQEITTFSLVSESEKDQSRIPIKNPLLADTSHLRTNLWQEHLNVCVRNISAGRQGCWIYEIGSLYRKSEGKINETKIIAGAITGESRFEKWSTNGKVQKLDYFEARGLLHKALTPLKIRISDKPLENDEILQPGRSSLLILEGKEIGKFGQLHPLIQRNYDIDKETYIFELDLNIIIQASIRKDNYTPVFRQFPTVPSMERDIALVIDKKCTSSQITTLIRKFGKPLLEDVQLIDRYEGLNLEDGKISQAFRITYRDKLKTLTESDINPIHEKIREMLRKNINAELRS